MKPESFSERRPETPPAQPRCGNNPGNIGFAEPAQRVLKGKVGAAEVRVRELAPSITDAEMPPHAPGGKPGRKGWS